MVIRAACSPREGVEDEKPDGNVEQTEAYYHQSHHGTAPEGDVKGRTKSRASRIGRTTRGIGGGLHAKETGQTREETTRKESEGHPRVLYFQHIGHEGEQQSEYDEGDKHDLVLLL